MIRATIAKNAKRKAKHKSTLGELPKSTPSNLVTVYEDGGLATAAANDTGATYAGRLVIASGSKTIARGSGFHHNNMAPITAIYAWRRQA